jgi:hypothetical protein
MAARGFWRNFLGADTHLPRNSTLGEDMLSGRLVQLIVVGGYEDAFWNMQGAPELPAQAIEAAAFTKA